MFIHGKWLTLVLCLCSLLVLGQQNRIKVTNSAPTQLEVCGKADTLRLEFRNISIQTVAGITAEVTLPAGLTYVPGSLISGTATELNVSNLQKPVFRIADLSITQSSVLKILVKADCQVLAVIGSGGSLTFSSKANYTGGWDAGNSTGFTARIPSVIIQSITNKSFSGAMGEMFTRIIEIKNFGNGPINMIQFGQKNGSGLSILGVRGGQITQKADSIFHKIDSLSLTKIGNNDGWLDPGESFFIYDTLRIAACANLLSNYWLTWGCNAKSCSSKTDIGNVIIKAIAPNLIFVPSIKSHACFGTDSVFEMSLKVINKGNDKARSTLIDLSQSVNFTYINYLFSRIDSSSIRFKKGENGTFQHYVAKGQLYNRNDGIYSCLGNNPLNAFTWEAGDINAGDTVIITWNVVTCCVSQCNSTKYMAGWKFAGHYKDQCDQVTNIPETIAWSGLSQYFAATSFVPSDIADGQRKTIIYTISSAGFWGLGTNSTFEFELVLKPGLNHSLNTDDFLVEAANGTLWKPQSITKNGDTIRAYFKYLNINYSQAEIRIVLSGSCPSSGKTSQLPYTLNLYYLPNSACKVLCKQQVFCTSGSIRVHCPVQCKGGMNFKNFSVDRVSYGLPDNNDDGLPDTTGTLDHQKIKKYIAMYSDTIQAVFSGTVTQSGSTYFWDYGYAKSTVLYGNYLKIVKATLEIYRGPTRRFICDSVPYLSSYSGNYGTFSFDFSRTAIATKGCTGASSYRLATGDSVCLKVLYEVNNNTGGTSLECQFSNDYYLGITSNPSGNQRLQCDTFNGNIVLTGYYFTNYGAGNYTLSGCTELTLNQNYYLSVGPCCGNYAGGNIFRYEYRNWARISEVKVIIPKGFHYQGAYTYYFRTAGTLNYKYDYLASIHPVDPTNDTLIFDMSKLYVDSGGVFYPSDDGFMGYLYIKVKADCEALTTYAQPVNYDMTFNREGLGFSTPETMASGANSDQIIYNRPNINITAVTNKIQASRDTVEWVVRLTNSSANSDASYTWLYFGKQYNIQVTGIKNLKTGVWSSNQRGVWACGSVNANSSTDFLIRAVYSSCFYDSLEVFSGWDCQKYPDTTSLYPCPPSKTWLYLEPTPTLLQTTLTLPSTAKDLCSQIPIEITVTNTDEPNAYELSLSLQLTPGMTILDSALEYKWHKDSTYRKLSYPTQKSGNQWVFQLDQSIPGLSSGFKGIADTLRNKIKLRMIVETNCDFTSGSFIRALPSAKIKCGLPVKAGIALSPPIRIKNIVEPYYCDVRMVTDTLKPCSEKLPLSFRLIFLGPQKTDSSDKFRLFLPSGYAYDSVSYQHIYQSPLSSHKNMDYNGIQWVEWSLPFGILPGDSSLFALQLKPVKPFSQCGATGILAQTAVSQDALCVKDSTFCSIYVQTGSQYQEKPVIKGNINLQILSASAQVNDSVSEKVKIEVLSENTSDHILNWTSKIYLISDRNNNQKFDVNDSLYAVHSFDSFLYGNKKYLKFSQIVLKEDICNLVILTDSSNCECSVNLLKIRDIPLKNAGIDTVICSGNLLQLGQSFVKGYEYQWNFPHLLSFDTISNPNFTYNNHASDTQTFRFILGTNRGQCQSEDTVIHVLPAIQFSLKDSSIICSGDSLIIGNPAYMGTGNLHYSWSSDSDLIALSGPLANVFPNSPKYFRVKVNDDAGCSIVDSIKILSFPKPKSQFTILPPCESEPLTWQDQSISNWPGYVIQQWSHYGTDIQNGTLMLNYPAQGSVKLVIENQAGCKDSSEVSYSVFPKGNIKLVADIPCAEREVEVSFSAVIPKGKFDTSFWIVNADTFKDKSIILYSKTPINQPITLYAETDSGCHVVVDSILSLLPKPQIDVDIPTICYGDSLILLLKTDIPRDSNRWEWLSHHYYDSSLQLNQVQTDTIHVRVIAFSKICSDTLAVNVPVHPLPTINFSGDTICLYDSFVSLNQSFIPTGHIQQFNWVISSGYSSTDSNIVVQFADSGIYEAKLIAISDIGCRDSLSKTIAVHPSMEPTFGISGVCESDTIQLTDASLYRGTSAASIQWTNGSTTASGKYFNFKTTAGDVSVKLNVSTLEGCLYHKDSTFHIYPLPVPMFEASYPCNDDSVSILNRSIGADRFQWFLDGNLVSVQQHYSARLNPNGSLMLLEAKTNMDCMDTMSVWLDPLKPVVPKFDFTSMCVDVEATPVDLSDPGESVITTYLWDFGDGSTFAVKSPIKSYKNSGQYLVKLEIKNNAGCAYSTEKSVEIYPKPIPGFDVFGEPLDIFKSEIQVVDKSLLATEISYTISDGASYQSRDFTHSFNDSGWYSVMQFVTSEHTCRDSLSRDIFVHYKYIPYFPNAFSPNNDGQNDYFGINGTGILHSEMNIYNRWGECVFSGSGAENFWDGKYKGENVMSGIYVYHIRVTTYSHQVYFYSGTIQVVH